MRRFGFVLLAPVLGLCDDPAPGGAGKVDRFLTCSYRRACKASLGCLIFLLAICLLAIQSARAGTDPADSAWGCYDPEPGHPTDTEQAAFFNKVIGPAKGAALRRGVPAAGISAMSMLESGYGFTRTAEFANNLFGWKASDSDSAAFVLICQTPSDPGNHYVRFADWAAAFETVSGRLGTGGKPAYAVVTDRYRSDRAAGVPIPQAVAAWVRGIQQAGYNPDTNYPSRVLRIANNYRSPGMTVSPEFNLYLLSEAVHPGRPMASGRGGTMPSVSGGQASALQLDVAAKIAAKFANGGRYVIGVDKPSRPHEFCKEIAAGDPLLANPLVAPYARLSGSPNAAILECNFTFEGPDIRHGWVLVVAATADNIAARIVGACTEVAPRKAAGCANGMLGSSSEMPWGSNSFIFPITGFVSEPCKDKGVRLIGFRHGVTIQYGSSNEKDASALDYCWTGIGDQGPDKQKQVALTNATNEVFNIGRIGAVSRFDVPGKSFPKEKPGLGADSFQAFVQANEIRAVETGYDRLMLIKAALLMKVAVPPDH
jgi:hypothetical protein